MERRVLGKYYKVESKEYNTEDEIKERIKQISRNLAYIKRRDAVSLSFGTDGEQDDLEAERDELRKKLNKLKRSSKKTEDKKLLVEDLDEAFYEKICRAYIDTMRLEWVTTNPENNSVVHGYFADDDMSDEWGEGSKVTPENYKDIVSDNDFSYEYDTWKDFYNSYIKDEIETDIHEVGIYDYDDNWDFYVSQEDLNKLGIAFDIIDESTRLKTESADFETYDEIEDRINGYLGNPMFRGLMYEVLTTAESENIESITFEQCKEIANKLYNTNDGNEVFDLLYAKIEELLNQENVVKVEEAKGKTWDEIFKDAEGATFGQRALKIKDQARAELEDLMKKDGINVEDYDGVEDAIDDYLKTHDIRFADNGCIITENKKKNVKVS